MKRVRLLIIILSLALLGGLFQATAQAATVVNFPDANLERVVRDALGKPTGDITDLEMLTLTSLDGPNRGIVDLQGLEYATNLVNLSLNFNFISNIAPVQNLTNLRHLALGFNRITDIIAVQNLTNLTTLNLSGNRRFSNITPLQNLTNLTDVNLASSSISDITPLQNLTNLRRLVLGWNRISDITTVQNLTSLTNLYLNNNSISNIAPVQNLTSLTDVFLNNNSISDITPVQNLTNLWRLHLGWNQISDITAVQNLTNLTTLYLNANQISDITAVQNLTNLTGLTFYNNSISDITPLVTNSLLGGLGVGDDVSLQYNYLDLSDGSDDRADIDALVDEGVNVAFRPQKEPDIDVSLLEYDFGDVAWLSPSTVIVTIANTGVSDLVVSNLNPAAGPWGSIYSIDNPPLLPVTIPVGGTIDLQITYTTFFNGPTSAVLEIESNDPDESVVQIALSGNGVLVEAPPDEQIQAILDFFDGSVVDGSLVGEGTGESANGRLSALTNMMEASDDLIQDGDIDGACQQLLDVYERVDGIGPPADFVSGSAAQNLASVIQGMREDLGCQ